MRARRLPVWLLTATSSLVTVALLAMVVALVSLPVGLFVAVAGPLGAGVVIRAVWRLENESEADRARLARLVRQRIEAEQRRVWTERLVSIDADLQMIEESRRRRHG